MLSAFAFGLMFAPWPLPATELCRELSEGRACEPVELGVYDGARGVYWRRLAAADGATFSEAKEQCRAQLGADWRLPTLMELEDGFARDALGWCSIDAWTTTAGHSPGEAWTMGVRYENGTVCETLPDGSTQCIGACGPYAWSRERVALDERRDILCLRSR